MAKNTFLFFVLGIVFCFGTMAQSQEPVIETLHPDTALTQLYRGGNGAEYSQADLDGIYQFRDLDLGKTLTLNQDEFLTYMQNKQSNKTIREIQGRHGWLAEYSTQDGRVYMWYPGNKKVMPGFWKVEKVLVKINAKEFHSVHICFQYPTGYNYVENKPGKNWDCWPASRSLAFPEKRRDTNGRAEKEGDVFNLQSGNIPFVLKKIKGQIGLMR